MQQVQSKSTKAQIPHSHKSHLKQKKTIESWQMRGTDEVCQQRTPTFRSKIFSSNRREMWRFWLVRL